MQNQLVKYAWHPCFYLALLIGLPLSTIFLRSLNPYCASILAVRPDRLRMCGVLGYVLVAGSMRYSALGTRAVAYSPTDQSTGRSKHSQRFQLRRAQQARWRTFP